MKARMHPTPFFVLLVLLSSFSGCILPQESPGKDIPVNETDLAITIALNDSLVRSNLTEPWTVMEVNLYTGSTVYSDENNISLHTQHVRFDTKSAVVNVFVDSGNTSVVHFYRELKPVPMPRETCTRFPESPHSGLPVNETDRAITVALNDSLVRSNLTEPWTVMEVNLHGSYSYAGGGKEVSYCVPYIKFDTRTAIVGVYVDPVSNSVVYIYRNPKRVPEPGDTRDYP